MSHSSDLTTTNAFTYRTLKSAAGVRQNFGGPEAAALSWYEDHNKCEDCRVGAAAFNSIRSLGGRK